MTWGGGRSEIHKQLVVNNDLSSPELLFRKNLQGDYYQSRLSLCSKLRGTSVEYIKSPKEDYEGLQRIDITQLIYLCTCFIA